MSESNDIAAWFGQAGAREEELRRADELVMVAAPGIDRRCSRRARRDARLRVDALAEVGGDHPVAADRARGAEAASLALRVRRRRRRVPRRVPVPTGSARCPAGRVASASPRSTRSTPKRSPHWSGTPSPSPQRGTTATPRPDRPPPGLVPGCGTPGGQRWNRARRDGPPRGCLRGETLHHRRSGGPRTEVSPWCWPRCQRCPICRSAQP